MARTAADVEHAIKGISFPANRSDLVNQAENNNAKSDIIDIIKDLPRNNFKSPIDVSKAFGERRRSQK
ncbi:MAG TPA: DUF2795 domain-containing protein [Methanobacterium sp.]|jgi:hypothetical protein|nr:MAG: DUF2795 domain-containing protein [Methanobacterium sp.]HOI70763.1 DUF2795 domain-containing protein [Methanobacterium sp.]